MSHIFRLDLVDDDGQGCGAVTVNVPDESMLNDALEDVCILLAKIVLARTKGVEIREVETSDQQRPRETGHTSVSGERVHDEAGASGVVPEPGYNPSGSEGTEC